jgi:hypothetical protein
VREVARAGGAAALLVRTAEAVAMRAATTGGDLGSLPAS